jgi:uncharacterized protein involved in outer membrane biogenesis
MDLLQGWDATLELGIGAITDDLTPVATKIRGNLDVSDGVLRLALEHAQVLGGEAFGTIKVTRADPPQAEAELGLEQGQIGQVGALPHWLPDGLKMQGLGGQVTLSAHGYSLASWLASLAGKVDVTAGAGSLPGLTLAAAAGATAGLSSASADKALFSGATPFDRLTASATLNQGELGIGDFSLSGSAGALGVTGQVDLVRGVCNLDLVLKPVGAAAGAAVLRGPVHSPAAWIVATPPGG